MDKLSFANHLGFTDWRELIRASVCVAYTKRTNWYVACTATWYKWIIWNPEFDFYYNHDSRKEALQTLKWIFEKEHVDVFQWLATEDYAHLHACFCGEHDSQLFTTSEGLFRDDFF